MSKLSGHGEALVSSDPKQISWTRALRADLERAKPLQIDQGIFTTAIYRPFDKEWLYFGRRLNEMVYQMPRIFPDYGSENLVIGMSGPGFRGSFSVLMTGNIPALHTADRDGAQCFPLYLYEQQDEESAGLFANQTSGLQRRDAITDTGLAHFQTAYPGHEITKEDIFYYVYGLLHSEEYRDRYADNLTKELPRIPCVKTYDDFHAFSDAGRQLGDLHVNYETVEPYPVTIKQGDLRLASIDNPEKFFRVEKMKFAGKRGDQDKSTVIYNNNITIQGIPLEVVCSLKSGPLFELVPASDMELRHGQEIYA